MLLLPLTSSLTMTTPIQRELFNSPIAAAVDVVELNKTQENGHATVDACDLVMC
jgi:arginase family enzyme